ncbi:MAG: hypothetical protein ACI88A_000406 [Paraglaciecola sp.]|jgi:hypothetical protein
MQLFRNFLVSSLLLVSSQSMATVINFDEFINLQWFGNSSISSQGFDIASTGASLTTGALATTSFCGPSCPDNGGLYLLGHGAGFTISAINGGTFSLLDFDAAEAHHGTSIHAPTIQVTGVLSDNTVVQGLFNVDNINDGDGPLIDFQNFITGALFTDVVSLNFEGIGGNSNFFSLDNINFAAVTSAAVVSAPGSALLMFLALAGLLATRRTARA